MKYLFRDLRPFLADGNVVRRFRAQVRVGNPDECWPWTGQTNNHGYGRLAISLPRRETGAKRKHVRLLAHRVAYALAVTDPGRQVLRHACDNPRCCNPAHLQPGTQLDNVRDAAARGRINLTGLAAGWAYQRGRRNQPRPSHCIHGHELTPDNLYVSPDEVRWYCRECGRMSSRRYQERRRTILRQQGRARGPFGKAAA